MRLSAALLVMLVACSGSSDRAEKTDLFGSVPEGDANESSQTIGPVTATIKVRPAAPRLGDLVFLELKVSSPDKVDIKMPEFGEALGRFTVVDYDFRESRESDSVVREQLYQLQAAASGKVRLPQLRIEVTDRRPDAENGSELQELLTDEVLLDVAPIESAADAQLRAGSGRIEIKPLRPWHYWWAWLILSIAVGLGLALFVLRYAKRAAVVARQSAYDRAVKQLKLLTDAGLPENDELDSWYVELSSVIRHYLEGRYAVRAPELTTEEFLRVAQTSADLTDEHRQMLADFLAGCDRVKFAGHQPSKDEQRAALAAAERFVTETKPKEVAA